jgi:hypothetical protein
MKIKDDSLWAKSPMWKKRLQGFGSYLIAAMTALVFPVEVDKAIYSILRDQFSDEEQKQV